MFYLEVPIVSLRIRIWSVLWLAVILSALLVSPVAMGEDAFDVQNAPLEHVVEAFGCFGVPLICEAPPIDFNTPWYIDGQGLTAFRAPVVSIRVEEFSPDKILSEIVRQVPELTWHFDPDSNCFLLYPPRGFLARAKVEPGSASTSLTANLRYGLRNWGDVVGDIPQVPERIPESGRIVDWLKDGLKSNPCCVYCRTDWNIGQTVIMRFPPNFNYGKAQVVYLHYAVSVGLPTDDLEQRTHGYNLICWYNGRLELQHGYEDWLRGSRHPRVDAAYVCAHYTRLVCRRDEEGLKEVLSLDGVTVDGKVMTLDQYLQEIRVHFDNELLEDLSPGKLYGIDWSDSVSISDSGTASVCMQVNRDCSLLPWRGIEMLLKRSETGSQTWRIYEIRPWEPSSNGIHAESPQVQLETLPQDNAQRPTLNSGGANPNSSPLGSFAIKWILLAVLVGVVAIGFAVT